jgi:outer membrane protein TolC
MRTFLCLLALGSAALAGGDETDPKPRRTLPLSAREAVALSLNHNLDLEVARYQPWIEDQNVLAALGAWDHTAYANAAGGERITPSFSFLSGVPSTEKFDTDTADFTLGLRKTLPFGAFYDLSFTSERTLTNSTFALINPAWTQVMGGTVTLPLLKGLSPTANTATLVITRHARDASVDQFEKTLGDSVFQVMQAYWGLVFAIENKKVKEQSLDVALRLLEDNRRKFERGVVARIDVTQADAGVASQQEGILTAEAAVLNAMDRLKRLVEPALLREDTLVVPVEAPRGLRTELDERAAVEQAMATALGSRPEVRQIERQLVSQDVTIAKSENDLLPRLDLSGRAYVNGTDDSFSGAHKMARDGDFRELSVLVGFEYPLEQSAARGALHRAELEKRRLRLQRRSLEDQVLVEVREAVREIKTNEKRIEATRRARVLAQEQLDGEMTRRDQGLSTTFRVLDVQEDLAQARTNEVKALIDYNLSLHKLDQVTGTLLEKNGIVLRENLQPRMGP